MDTIGTLYHAFPRRRLDDHDVVLEKGLKVLERILQYGLLITPETIKWQTKKSLPPTHVAQKRVCFTALQRDELDKHARVFGPFSVGFDRAFLEGIGATPVFYLPRGMETTGRGRNTGSFYIERLFQIQAFLDNNPRTFQLNGQSVSTRDLRDFVSFLTGFFYPIEGIAADSDRLYYAQREWRMLANLFYGTTPISRKLSDEEKHDIRSTDTEFFDRQIEMATGTHRRIDQCALIHEIDGRPIRLAIIEIVAPEATRSAVENLIEKFRISPHTSWL